MSVAVDALEDLANLPTVLARFVDATRFEMTEIDFFMFMSQIGQGDAWALAEEEDVVMVAEMTIPGLASGAASMLAEHFAAIMDAVSGFVMTLAIASVFEDE